VPVVLGRQVKFEERTRHERLAAAGVSCRLVDFYWSADSRWSGGPIALGTALLFANGIGFIH
jgi:hypothetical protein